MTEPQPQRRSGALPWTALALGLALLLLIAEYVIVRMVSSPSGVVEMALGVVALLLVVLAVCGFLGSRRGHAAPFVAVALVLPYLIVGVGTVATYQRVSDTVGNIVDDFNSASNTTDTTTDVRIKKDKTNPNATPAYLHGSKGDFVDRNNDTVDDRFYAGQDCSNKAPEEGYYDTCMGNGGLDDTKTGDGGLFQGDPGFLDKNHDKVDDHFYDGANCQDIMGGQQEFAECDANGGTAPQ